MIPRDRRQFAKRFGLWARRVRLTRRLAFALAVASVLSGVATVVTMTGSAASGPDPRTVVTLLYLDVILLLLLSGVVARRLATVWAERRKGLAGSGLHIRVVMLFSLVAITPAVLVAVFSALFLNFGVHAWFNERVRTALADSHAVATAYLHEHRQTIRADAFAMANDLNREASALMRNSRRFAQVLSTQAALRDLSEALVVDSNGQVLARSEFSLALAFDLVPQSAIARAEAGQIAVLTSGDDERVRAVVKLIRFVDAYLVVGRFVDATVIDHIERTRGAVAQYQRMEERREGIQITFVMIFVVVALLLLMAAVWIGLNFATQLARPISNLIQAADRVRKGDLAARVAAPPSADEIGTLSRSFNRMTSQLESQQAGLMEANRQLDERRRFTETVLAGVSAGVIGLDDEGRIHLPNRSASELLDTKLEQALGRHLGDVVPEMAEHLQQVVDRPERMHRAQLKLPRPGGVRTLLVRIAAEGLGGDVIGYVVTFDDVTELLSAQRKAAWADVARRIAHEIKNPLTPIQLSAERLKRRYLKEIESDPETFAICTETIMRQVEDIGRMVDEFSSFARMPQAQMKPENLSEIVRQAVFLERNRHDGIAFDMDLPGDDLQVPCDSRQIARAVGNILKNAAESIVARRADDPAAAPPGRVHVSLAEGEDDGGRRVIVRVDDNGIGLPAGERDRLTEPYVTTRDKGTGLGLAIVKKIVEDHGGDLVLEDGDGEGARVSLVFRPDQAGSVEDETPEEAESRAMSVAASVAAQGS